MCDMTGFSVIYEGDDKCTISPHCCRTIDCSGGMSYDEACDMVAEHYENLAKDWRNRTSMDAQWYKPEE